MAADGLPTGPDAKPDVAAIEPASPIPNAAPASVSNAAPAGHGSVSTTVVLPVATSRPPQGQSTTVDGGSSVGDGTIVAHAVASGVVARTRPSPEAEVVIELANPTDRGGPLVFQAIGEPRNGWLEVLLPIRPNGSTGWIDLNDVSLSRNPYSIEVDLGSYELTVRRLDEIEISAPVAIGQGGTPTPVGDYYLIELLQPPQPDGPYGSYAYGLSGYSDVLDNFNGGEGVIGIHGTNRPELLGGPASNGCIRIHNDVIELMAEFLPLGTPVSIVEPDRSD